MAESKPGFLERFRNRGKKIDAAVDSAVDGVKESNETQEYRDAQTRKKEEKAMKQGYKKGGSIDGCAVRGKTKGRMI